jgi:hypothetical protein
VAKSRLNSNILLNKRRMKMIGDNVVSEKNSNGTYTIKIKEGNTLYEIPSVNIVFAPGTNEDWLVKITKFPEPLTTTITP